MDLATAIFGTLEVTCATTFGGLAKTPARLEATLGALGATSRTPQTTNARATFETPEAICVTIFWTLAKIPATLEAIFGALEAIYGTLGAI